MSMGASARCPVAGIFIYADDKIEVETGHFLALDKYQLTGIGPPAALPEFPVLLPVWNIS